MAYEPNCMRLAASAHWGSKEKIPRAPTKKSDLALARLAMTDKNPQAQDEENVDTPVTPSV